MPSASVVITTRNRRDELRVALKSVTLQQGADIEIIVIDDGSDDGTTEMVQGEFPNVRLERRDTSLGLIVRRNEAARLATAPIIVSIDDDAAFPFQETIATTLDEFDHLSVGAVAIPFINVNQDTTINQLAPDDGRLYEMFAYIGTAHAVRRDVFVALGGYRDFLVHQGEELDFCIRMMDAGYIVKAGRSPAIHHFESPRRMRRRMTVYGARNVVLFSVLNVPFPYLPVHLVGSTWKTLAASIRQRHAWWTLQGLLWGYWTALSHVRSRSPVKQATYKRFRALKRANMLPVRESRHDDATQ